MPTRNINLTPEQDSFVDKVVKSGEYQNASEAVRDALAHAPEGSMTQDRARLARNLRSFHLRQVRIDDPETRVGGPVHVIYYRAVRPGLIEIVRVLHERMEPSRHVGSRLHD